MYYSNPIYNFDYSTVIRIGSLSKSLSLTGLRTGYIVGGLEFISAFTLFNQHISTCTNSLSNAILERITKTCFNNHIAILKEVYFLRDELNTLTTSGSHYGKTFEKYVRICLSVDESSLSDFVSRLTEKLLK